MRVRVYASQLCASKYELISVWKLLQFTAVGLTPHHLLSSFLVLSPPQSVAVNIKSTKGQEIIQKVR